MCGVRRLGRARCQEKRGLLPRHICHINTRNVPNWLDEFDLLNNAFLVKKGNLASSVLPCWLAAARLMAHQPPPPPRRCSPQPALEPPASQPQPVRQGTDTPQQPAIPHPTLLRCPCCPRCCCGVSTPQGPPARARGGTERENLSAALLASPLSLRAAEGLQLEPCTRAASPPVGAAH